MSWYREDKSRNAVPPNWAWTTATEVCGSVRDGTHSTPSYVENGVPLITSKNLRPHGLDFGNVRNIGLDDHIEIGRRSGVEKGDVLYAMIGTIGNPVVVMTDKQFSIKNVGLFKKNESAVDSWYLAYWLSSSAFAQILETDELIKGTTQKFVPLGNLRVFPIPLAPLNEQRRIVEAIETHFTRLDAAVAALKRSQANLRRYRASVLKAACEGRLVLTEAELAKAEGRDYESADVLLARILKERRRKWEEAEWAKLVDKAKKKVAQARRKAAGRPARLSDLAVEEWQDVGEDEYARYLPKNDKWKAKYKEPQSPDTDKLPGSPNGWTWASAEQLTSLITDGEHLTPPRSESGVLLLSARNIRDGYLSLDNVDYVPPHIYRKLCQRLEVSEGDVLMSCSGTVGRSCVAPAEPKFALVRSVAVLRPIIDSAKYLSFAIRSPLLQAQIDEKKTQTAQANIFQGKIRTLVFPVSPLVEQHRIVAEVERRLSVVDALEVTVAANLARAARLRQSILKRAFAGELVPQDPDDEPASVLLGRINRGENKPVQATKIQPSFSFGEN